MDEKKIKEEVQRLKRFYMDLTIYGAVNVGLILVWAVTGGGTFWPIFVIIGWGIGIAIQAFSLGIFPMIGEILPFLGKDWEKKQVERLMKGAKKKSSKESQDK